MISTLISAARLAMVTTHTPHFMSSSAPDQLLSLIDDLQQAFRTMSGAWAHRVESAQKAYLAALSRRSLT